jgi:acyl-CoA thioester hydrolase
MNDARRSPAAIEQFAHRHREVIRWGDMDAFGHVNNVQFFRYLESARVAYARAVIAHEVKSEGESVILADMRCSFRQQLLWPGELDIYTRTARIGRSSMGLEQLIFRAGETDAVATSESVLVWFDFHAQRPAPIPDALRARLRAFESRAPQES